MFCQKCGAENPDIVQVAKPTAARPSSKVATFAFAGLSGLTILVSLATGITPIYLFYAILWAAVAWYWHAKKPANSTALVLYLAVGGSGLFGYLLPHSSQVEHDSMSKSATSGDIFDQLGNDERQNPDPWAQVFPRAKPQESAVAVPQTPAPTLTKRKSIPRPNLQGKITCSGKTIMYDVPQVAGERRVIDALAQDEVVSIEGKQEIGGDYRVRKANGSRGYIAGDCVEIQ